MGKFAMSAYYIPTEAQYGEDSALWPIYAVMRGDPGCKLALSKSHGYDCEANYDNLRLARHDFLYDRTVTVGPLPRDGAGVCVQGTGKLNSGEYISCVDPAYVLDDDVRFDWQLEDKVNRLENSVISFETVAVCFSDTEKSVLLPLGTEIVIPDLEDYMKSRHNANTTFTVRDTGEGLCKGNSGAAYETIDIFTGEAQEGLDAANAIIIEFPKSMQFDVYVKNQ